MSKRIISFQLEKEELKALDEAAKAAGKDRSKFLRSLINDYVEGESMAHQSTGTQAPNKKMAA